MTQGLSADQTGVLSAMAARMRLSAKGLDNYAADLEHLAKALRKYAQASRNEADRLDDVWKGQT